MVRRLAKIALATTLVLVLLALAAGLVFAGSASHIAAGVEIAGVNVGGLTADEAQARLEAVARRYESVPVAFTAGGATFPLRPSDVEAARTGLRRPRRPWSAATGRSRCAASSASGSARRGPTSSPRSRSTSRGSTTG